ncbi:MAG: hypothetical protein HW388_787 [Dehalococcoidia bacterium]|nr:hypothetical protein [Dehalococcoidia bacterium]
MTLENQDLPHRPFFSCTPQEFTIVDSQEAKDALRGGSIKPWMSFKVGQANIIDTRPRRVLSWHGNEVTVECDGGTVRLDFSEGSARKTTPHGQFVYRGGIEERNEGMGYMPLS